MKTIFEFFIIAALALCLSGNAWAEPPIRIVVYGDSLMGAYQMQPEEAFPARLDQKLKKVGFSNVEVINMSASNQTTADALDRLNSVLSLHPDIVILELGTDDALNGIGINVIYKNLGAILQTLAQNKVYTIIIGNKAPARMGSGYNTQFKEIYRRLAEAFALPFYPFALAGVAGNPDLNMADGIHPNAKGAEIMTDQIYPLVDAAVRWEFEVQQQQEQWRQQNQAPFPDAAPATD